MKLEDVKKRLTDTGMSIIKEERLSNETGTQLRLDGGPIVNVFANGTVNYQGKNRETVKAVVEGGSASVEPAPTAAPTNIKVFVVYGHDATARDQLEANASAMGP
jgi:predicted nucleotide-binding protein